MGLIVDWFGFILGFIVATFFYLSIALFVTGHWIIAIVVIVVLILLVGMYLMFPLSSYPG